MEPVQIATSSIGRAKVLARARGVTPARGEAFTILPHQRLQQLHQISRSLIASCDPEATIATVVGMMDDTVLVRSAVCILCDGTPSSMIWSADGVSYEQLQAATARALGCCEYLLGPSAPQLLAPHREQEPVRRGSGFTSLMDRRRVILLPLAVEHERCLGVIQIEGFERFTEVDLVFISAIASELAVALARQTSTQARLAAAAMLDSGTVEQQIRVEARGPRCDGEAPGARAERLRTEMSRTVAETAQAQAQRTRLAATELRSQYENVLSNMDRAFIWEADASTLRLSYLSARVEALLGFPVSRWLEEARFFLQRVHPDDRPLVEHMFDKALSRESPHCEHRMISADGHVQWFQTSVHLSRGHGPAAALQGISSAIPGGRSAAEQATLAAAPPERRQRH